MKKIKIPHPVLQCPKVRKRRVEAGILIVVCVALGAHYIIPDYEAVMNFTASFLFWLEPKISVEV